MLNYQVCRKCYEKAATEYFDRPETIKNINGAMYYFEKNWYESKRCYCVEIPKRNLGSLNHIPIESEPPIFCPYILEQLF